MAKEIVLVALDKCIGSSVLGAADLFCVANVLAASVNGGQSHIEKPFTTRIVSLGDTVVPTVSGHSINAEAHISDIQRADIVMVPGLGIDRPQEFEVLLPQFDELYRELKRFHEGGSIVTASCTGTYVLAESGLLDGKRATTTWWLQDYFASRYPDINLCSDQMFVDEPGLLTSAAGASFLDLTLHLISLLAGPSLAHLVAKYMVVDAGGRSQRPYMVPWHFMKRDSVIEQADAWIRSKLPGKISVADLADHIGVTTRTLNRRFQKFGDMSPQSFIQQVRLEQAKTLLETTNKPVASVGYDIGYQDENAFRRAFLGQIGISPAQYRQRFQMSGY